MVQAEALRNRRGPNREAKAFSSSGNLRESRLGKEGVKSPFIKKAAKNANALWGSLRLRAFGPIVTAVTVAILLIVTVLTAVALFMNIDIIEGDTEDARASSVEQ